MTPSERLGLATRAFFLATVVGLAAAFREPRVFQATLVILALGALALASTQFTVIPPRWVYLVEGFLAALVIGATLPEGAMLLPYLMVPALLTGVGGKIVPVVVVSGLEMLALLLALLVGGVETPTQEGIELAAPWAVASLGAGLVGVWLVQLRGTRVAGDEVSYESARRLLSQLRTVARRLSSGLDPVSMADAILAAVHERLGATRAAVFVRTEGGVLAPLGYRGVDAQGVLLPEGPAVDTCWAEMEPVVAVPGNGHGGNGHGPVAAHPHTVLPLRNSARMIGVVVVDLDEPPSHETVVRLMAELDEQAVRLDAALVFDEVRSLATMEERQRLAREIHDGVAQEIASLGYLVDDLAATSAGEEHRGRLHSLRGEISRVVSELRLSIFDLRSEISPAAGLGSALSDYVRAVGARSGLTVHLTLDEAPTRLRGEVEMELLRITQEAVTNARKHANARNLWVDCRIQPPYARISVEDDGGGLGPPREDSYGMKIMRERAERIDARLEIGPRNGTHGTQGTKVAVTVGAEPTRGS
ncbi:sensor histidine kinase [Nocardioides caldifontis]|uniref:sensor histidine kinase n=1 Tax=Nocardioides caldifontis TaxID=2588938 RepID=UPI0011DFE893|nr:histidine kinase [Nocardioides caldifontis]